MIYKCIVGGRTVTLLLYLSPVQWHWRLSFPPQLIHCQQVSNVIFEKLGNIKKNLNGSGTKKKKTLKNQHYIDEVLIFSLTVFSTT